MRMDKRPKMPRETAVMVLPRLFKTVETPTERLRRREELLEHGAEFADALLARSRRAQRLPAHGNAPSRREIADCVITDD